MAKLALELDIVGGYPQVAMEQGRIAVQTIENLATKISSGQPVEDGEIFDSEH